LETKKTNGYEKKNFRRHCLVAGIPREWKGGKGERERIMKGGESQIGEGRGGGEV